MLQRKKESVDVEKFWSDYEASIGEKVLAKSLGQYLSGWAQFPYPLWGLLIATTGGFRFHHFAHEGWFIAFARISSGGEPPKEKTFFIPNDSIISIKLITEKRWWKKILPSSNPTLVICCIINGEERKIVMETDRSDSAGVIVNVLGSRTGQSLQPDNSGTG